MIVDVHTHFYPREYLALLEAHAEGIAIKVDAVGRRYLEADGARLATLTGPMLDLADRLAAVDAQGVAVQVLSLTSPNVYVFPDHVAIQAARLVNRAYARIKAEYPGRFCCLASVPLGTGAEADELTRAIQADGLDGVIVGTNVRGRPIDDPAFAAFWRRADELALPVLLHPMAPPPALPLREFSLVPLVGFPLDTTVALARLLYAGFVEQYPRVKVIATHAGGALPYLLGRLDIGYSAYPECQIAAAPPSACARRLYYDTISYHPPALACLVASVGADRLLFGSDFPHVIGSVPKVVESLRRTGLESDALDAICWRNARDGLGLAIDA
ncbi:MAG: amidohydrolase family protein [Armatimonadota bacterium]|nr:amidohydrolase family protein [Armatimonadota bacterium]MDR7533782.1 amidohydrolase family protein [Armatimonadota bacterium]MDR7535772.1 amidohydrolase family protein [Armatimonadota bacterium]